MNNPRGFSLWALLFGWLALLLAWIGRQFKRAGRLWRRFLLRLLMPLIRWVGWAPPLPKDDLLLEGLGHWKPTPPVKTGKLQPSWLTKLETHAKESHRTRWTVSIDAATLRAFREGFETTVESRAREAYQDYLRAFFGSSAVPMLEQPHNLRMFGELRPPKDEAGIDLDQLIAEGRAHVVLFSVEPTDPRSLRPLNKGRTLHLVTPFPLIPPDGVNPRLN